MSSDELTWLARVYNNISISPVLLSLLFQDPHLQYGLPPMVGNMKRSVDAGQMDMMDGQDSSDEDSQVCYNLNSGGQVY